MPATVDEIDGVLRTTPVFQKLSADDRRKIAEVAAVRRYEKGQLIFEQGTPSDAFYTIASGRVKIFRMLPAGKVAASHGVNHPELQESAAIFEDVADEMASHMMKEEEALFPYIEKLELAVRRREPAPGALFGSVDKPIAMMELEHEHAGQAMERIREISKNYALPGGACITYATCFRELEEFERDLHVHVHLENNVLFPKARALAASIAAAGGTV
jgi:Hemerythrin HHE cation binding domain/Cyclic nucleotide-binding domain